MTQTSTSRPQASPELQAAIARLQIGDNRGALAMAEAALRGQTDRAPLLAVAGLAALRLREPARAIPHLVAMLEIRPDDRATRANLANAYVETGNYPAALALVAGAEDAKLARIEGFVRQQGGELDHAAAAYRRALAADENDLSSWNNLGNVLAAQGAVDEAIHAFEMAITLAPGELSIYRNLADVLRAADRPVPLLKVLRDAHAVAPKDVQVMIDLGLAHARLDEYDAAVEVLRRAADQSPGFSDAHIELGMIFENLNRVDDLVELAAGIDPQTAPPEAAFLLAWRDRRLGRFEDAARHLERIPDTIHPMRRFHLVGGVADRLEDPETAYAAFVRMNEEAVASSPPDNGPTFREEVLGDLAKWTDQWAAGWQPFAPDDGLRDPVFLVGFPRSGTTLLDTMLMGQEALSVLEERPMVARTIERLGERDLPDLSPDSILELRAAYFDCAREYGWDPARWLVDKHPLNMERVPTIHRLFPKARIILAERHPYDVVFSCFMANFQLNKAMRSFTTLDEAARTYDAVFSAWERGTALFPVDVHRVRYERLVGDARRELEPLVAWLGLSWSDRLLDHTATARERGRVKTASYSQIGEKLYTRARDRWRRYARQLEPVMPILRPWAERMGYEAD